MQIPFLAFFVIFRFRFAVFVLEASFSGKLRTLFLFTSPMFLMIYLGFLVNVGPPSRGFSHACPHGRLIKPQETLVLIFLHLLSNSVYRGRNEVLRARAPSVPTLSPRTPLT